MFTRCRVKFRADTKAIRYHEGVNSNSPGRHKSFTHIEHRAGTVGRGGWCIRFQSSLLKIYFRLSGFQASLLLIYFRDVPNITLRQSMAQNLFDMWHSTFDRSCFWTEAQSSMIFVAAKKLYGIVWTKPLFLLRWCYTRRFATTIFSATQRCFIVAILFRMVATLFQYCNALLR